MAAEKLIGGFEQMVLLTITRLGHKATALEVAAELEACSGRSVSRGALYTTFHRLEKRGFLEWQAEAGGSQRAGIPRRRFSVTPAGLEVLRYTRDVLLRLWDGSEEILGGHNS